MKTISTDKLTGAYLQQLNRFTYLATALTTVLVVLVFFVLLFRSGGHEETVLFTGGACAIASLVGSILCLQTAYRGRYGGLQLERRHQSAWVFIGMALLSLSIGTGYSMYQEVSGSVTFPSLADVFANLVYPLLLIGIFLMPTISRFQACISLDAIITMLCCLGISWSFLLGPLYFAHSNHTALSLLRPGLITVLSYPGWDLGLILAVALLLLHRTEPVLHPSLLLLTAGAGSAIIADSVYTYTNIHAFVEPRGAPYLSPFWLLGSCLIGLSSLYQYRALVYQAYHQQPTGRQLLALAESPFLMKTWRHLQNMPVYGPMIILLLLTAYSAAIHNHVSMMLVMISVLSGILLVIRYYLAARENEAFSLEKEHRREMAERLRDIVTRLTEPLDLAHLRERIVSMAVTDMGFDAALLLMGKEHDHPVGIPPLVFVNVAAVDMPTISWRFQDDALLYRIFRVAREMTVTWDVQDAQLPTVVQDWLHTAQVSTMFFFPVMYLGKNFGTLGVSCKGTMALRSGDAMMMKLYVEQVARLVEHARLYQEAREHEEFARAMANMATRLNAAVVEQTEISHLICKEGARALYADYVLLYTTNDAQPLTPVAVYYAPEEEDLAVDQWPAIEMSASEAQPLHSLQAKLLYIKTDPIVYRYPPIGGVTPSDPPTSSTESHADGSREGSSPPALHSLHEKLASLDVRTAILVPLTSRGDSVGILIFARGQAQDQPPFDTQDLRHAQDFGEQAGVAFTNARLYWSLQRAHRQLQELDQMKDQFMITASHELRTPLTAVQGYIELIAEYGDALPPSQLREFLHKARRSCDELAVLLGNVMDASRLDADVEIRSALLKHLSVAEMVSSVVLLMEPHLTQEERELHVQVPADLEVRADPIRLRQVLVNVCTNALKYSPPRTPITITARLHPETGRASMVLISITDKGNGICPEEQEHIFERFYRMESDMNSPVRGSGLGLYISRRLIEAMKGKIWVESKGIAGEGSTFHIQLPIA